MHQQNAIIDTIQVQHQQNNQHYIANIKHKWNSNQEIVDILCSVQIRPQWVSSHAIQRPSSGTQIIYPRYDGTWFKNDDFVWRRRREGKLVREDHMKLKIHKQQVISANYVHSAVVPWFHRRVYWLTHNPGYVLVHYLNESNMDKGMQSTAESIAECMKANNVHLNQQQLVDQLCPIYAHCLKPEDIQILANMILGLSRQPSVAEENQIVKKYTYDGSTSASSPDNRGDAKIDIIEVSPCSSTVMGNTNALVIGGFYMKGHDYHVGFGNNRVKAKLIQAGVLSVIVPPAECPQDVVVQVFCNGELVSKPFKSFAYTSSERQAKGPERCSRSNEGAIENIAELIFERIRIIAYALNSYKTIEQMSNVSLDDASLATVVKQLVPTQPYHYAILNGPFAQIYPKTVLHLATLVDFEHTFGEILALSDRMDHVREFDIIARDNDGCTPLHMAVRSRAAKVARLIVARRPTSVDVIDDRGRTPLEMVSDSMMMAVLNRNEVMDCRAHLDATELWVMTNGETVTREHLLLNKLSKTVINDNEQDKSIGDGAQFTGTPRECEDDCESLCDHPLHVEISMDTNVHVPDSPKMARLFHVVTSPGVMVTENARAKMADLARQIIDALPEKIKRSSGSLFGDDDSVISSHFTSQHNPMLSQNNICCSSIESSCNVTDQLYDMMVVADTAAQQESFIGAHTMSAERMSDGEATDRFAPSQQDERSFASTRANTFESDTLDFDKNLGEFFTIDIDRSIDPIEQRLANLKYNDDEQRDVYEAAMVIQRAYREYRARNTSRRQEDLERRAALKIQGCYRRYKQFCYFKKLHNAAIVVQKHFRMRKKDDKEECGSNLPEHPTLDGQSIRIQVPQNNSSLLREHRAATTIQLAYRGHRKRQAAARKIQNFMRQSRNKLRKMHAQNDDAVQTATQQTATQQTGQMRFDGSIENECVNNS